MSYQSVSVDREKTEKALKVGEKPSLLMMRWIASRFLESIGPGRINAHMHACISISDGSSPSHHIL